jgi:hypothetical protein
MDMVLACSKVEWCLSPLFGEDEEDSKKDFTYNILEINVSSFVQKQVEQVHIALNTGLVKNRGSTLSEVRSGDEDGKANIIHEIYICTPFQ